MSEVTNEDCMVGIARYPDKYFDLAIVDPPYGIGLDMVNNHGTFKTIHKEKGWNNQIPGPEYFEELYRVSKHQIIWGCNYYASFIPAVGRIVHDKLLEIKDTALRYSECDLASCSLQKRITIFRYKWNGNVQGNTINWKNTGADARIHPTQKPLALYRYLLTNYAKSGDKILDTHLGSGSSRIAAHEMGFDFTGFELDKEYFDAQEKRFEKYLSQQVLFA